MYVTDKMLLTTFLPWPKGKKNNKNSASLHDSFGSKTPILYYRLLHNHYTKQIFFCTNVKTPLCNIKVKTPGYPVFFLNACYTSPYWLKLCEKWTQTCMESSFCVCLEWQKAGKCQSLFQRWCTGTSKILGIVFIGSCLPAFILSSPRKAPS